MGPIEVFRWLRRTPSDAPRVLRLSWHALQPAWSPLRRTAPSALPIDVVMPLADRHREVFRVAVESVRRFVRHPIGTIWVVGAADGTGLEAVAEVAGCTYVPEGELFSEPAWLELPVAGADRGGWIRQQLVKLSSDRLSEAGHVLVLDADTVFARPVSFESRGRQRLFFSGQRWEPYFTTAFRLLGPFRRAPYSFITHHMLLDLGWLGEMKELIERRADRPWQEAILEALDRREMSSFSEYETYGNFVYWQHPDACELRYWHNLSRSLDTLAPLDEIVKRYGHRYNTVSYHYRW